MYLNLAKALDKVPHEMLLRKVQSHGVTGNVSTWIASWLSGRKQRVLRRGRYSIWR